MRIKRIVDHFNTQYDNNTLSGHWLFDWKMLTISSKWTIEHCCWTWMFEKHCFQTWPNKFLRNKWTQWTRDFSMISMITSIIKLNIFKITWNWKKRISSNNIHTWELKLRDQAISLREKKSQLLSLLWWMNSIEASFSSTRLNEILRKIDVFLFAISPIQKKRSASRVCNRKQIWIFYGIFTFDNWLDG